LIWWPTHYSEGRDSLKDPEDADFDAGTADEVMQVVALGEVVYG
jgi:hypothetical protein